MFIELLLIHSLIGTIETHSIVNTMDNPELNRNTRIVLSNKELSKDFKNQFKSENPEIRIKVLDKISQGCTESGFEILLNALNDADPRIRSMAAMILGKNKKKTAVPFLIKTLEDVNYTVRSSAALALGRLKATESTTYLIKLLHDEHFTVKMSSSYALGVLGSQEAIPELIKLLNDANPQVRENTAWVLGLLRAKDAKPYLKLLAQDPNQAVRASARKALFFISYSVISDTSQIEYTGGQGTSFTDAVKISGIKNSFVCIKSQKEYISKYYGEDNNWEQVDQKHVKYNNRHFNLITIKENTTGNERKFYFDISELFKNN